MNNEGPVGVLVEGTIGDSLILVPTFKLLEQRFPDRIIHVISFTNAEVVSAEFVLAATFPSFKFSVISNSAGQTVFRRLSAWLKLTELVRSLNLGVLIYAFRPESQRSSLRAKLHKIVIKLLTQVKTYAFNVNRWPVSEPNTVRCENLVAKILFDRVAGSIGLATEFSSFDHKIAVAKADRAAGLRWLDQQFQARPENYYVICVSGKTASQRWPLKRYLHVVVALHKLYNIMPVFVGAPSEASCHNKLIEDLGFGYTLAGLTIGQSSAVIQQAMFYLGNDTGPMHLATGLGLKCVVVQSSRNLIGTWDPLGEGHYVLHCTPDCAGCGLVECNLVEQLCLTNITVDKVLKSCTALLTKTHHLVDPNL